MFACAKAMELAPVSTPTQTRPARQLRILIATLSGCWILGVVKNRVARLAHAKPRAAELATSGQWRRRGGWPLLRLFYTVFAGRFVVGGSAWWLVRRWLLRAGFSPASVPAVSCCRGLAAAAIMRNHGL